MTGSVGARWVWGEDDVAGTKIRSMNFFKPPQYGLPFFSLLISLILEDAYKVGGNSHIVLGREWLGYVESFLHTSRFA